MSSKVYGQEDARRFGAIMWRRVGGPGPGDQPGEWPVDAGAATNELRRLEARLSAAEQETRRRVEEARQAGLREGETAGRERAVAELRNQIERLARSVQDLASLQPRLRREAESDLVRLSIAVARRVLRRELAVDPEALRGVIHAAFERLDAREVSRVRIHPGQAPLLKACLEKLRPAVRIEILPDPGLDPGAAIFETARGDLDVSVEAQLEEIERGLTDRLRRQP